MPKATYLRFFLDFDGTLVPLASHPDAVLLEAKRRHLLTEVAQRYPTAIVSGRSRNSLLRHLGDGPWHLIGDHGCDAGDDYSPLPQEVLKQFTEATDKLAQQLPADTFLEKKKYSFTLHYRHKPELKNAYHGLLAQFLAESEITTFYQLTQAKMAWEIRPHFNKGDAVFRLLAKNPGFPIVIGDDTTDEAMFSQVVPNGLCVHVGSSSDTLAPYHIDDVAGVWSFLSQFQKPVASQN